jgi:hypothetical protein
MECLKLSKEAVNSFLEMDFPTSMMVMLVGKSILESA